MRKNKISQEYFHVMINLRGQVITYRSHTNLLISGLHRTSI